MAVYRKAVPATSDGVQKGLFNADKPEKLNPFLTKNDQTVYNAVSQTTLDITGMTILNMSGLLNYGIVNLTSSNSTETINIVSNLSSTDAYKFQPKSTLVVTFNDKTIGGAGANLKLAAPSLVADGSNGGYLVIQKRETSGDAYQTEFLDTYNP